MMRKTTKPYLKCGGGINLNTDFVQAITHIEGVKHCLILTPEADTLFSPSLNMEENGKDMEMFLSMLGMINDIRMDETNQIKSATWNFEHGCFIISLIKQHTFLIQYEGKLRCELFYEKITSTLKDIFN